MDSLEPRNVSCPLRRGNPALLLLRSRASRELSGSGAIPSDADSGQLSTRNAFPAAVTPISAACGGADGSDPSVFVSAEKTTAAPDIAVLPGSRNLATVDGGTFRRRS